MRSLKTLTMIALKNGRKVMCELGFQHMTDTDTANAAMKQKGGEEGGEDENEEEGQSSECINHSMALQCVHTTRLQGLKRVRIQ
jgi:hypothetical protein